MAIAETRPFVPFHRNDRNFFLAFLILLLAGVVTGFGWDVIDRAAKHTANWPIVVHIHAFFFVLWLAFLTAQILLVRNKRTDLHRKLGWYGAGLAAIMLAMGIAVSWFMDIRALGTPQADPQFLSIQLNDLIDFPVLVTAGILLRNESPAHKRLLLLATAAITDAGFARIMFQVAPHWFTHGFVKTFAVAYIGNDLVILALGAYDLITRRRLHWAWMAGAGFIFATQLIAIWLYLSPAWKTVALHMLGR
jgi:uncharacterized membrane protein